MKREKGRLHELRTLPYEEYLLTPEWQETRKAALRRAGNRCQVCGEQGALAVSHTNDDNLGCEQESDVIVLCEACTDQPNRRYKVTSDDNGTFILGDELAEPHFSLSQKALVFTPSALVGVGLPAFLHAPLPAELFGLAAAVALAVNSPKIYAEMRDSLPVPLVEFLDGQQARKHTRVATGEWNTWDRLLGRHLRESDPPATQFENQREDIQHPEPPLRPEQGEVSNDELPLPSSVTRGKFIFSSVLERFTPTLDRIYLASTMDGRDLFCPAESLCHVALAGSTDGGKSSIMRVLMVQLCKAGAQVLLLNPHYTRYDLKKLEDWTPFEPYLVYDPMECRKYEVIEHYLKYTAETLLPRRLDKYAHSLPTGKPYFIVMDELPSIIKHIPKATGWLGEILREGRKVGIFVISASQDFLVKTIAPDGSGGAVRDCYRTAYYVGGDATTAKTLLDMAPRDIPESELGQGRVMVRCARSLEAKKALLARVPYGDNSALYRLLGPSTYQPAPAVSQTPGVDLVPTPVVAQPGTALPQQGAQAPLMDRSQRRVAAGQAEGTASLRHPATGLPQVLRAASAVYVPGMTYRELGAALGYSDREARDIWQELRRRGLLRVSEQGTPTTSTEVAPTRPALYPLPRPIDNEKRGDEPKTRHVTPSDLAKAFALWQTGASSVRKLEAAAKAAGYGWSNGMCRTLIDAMENQGLITKREANVL